MFNMSICMLITKQMEFFQAINKLLIFNSFEVFPSSFSLIFGKFINERKYA